MKKQYFVLPALCLMLTAAGCQPHESADPSVTPSAGTVEYTNLVETDLQNELSRMMAEAGISEIHRQIFFDQVNYFNGIVSPDALTTGFETHDIMMPKYDPYAMQEEWEEKSPDFFGYNCRITAFSLLGDLITVPADAEIRDELLFFDLMALEENASALPNEGDLAKFSALYSKIPTEATRDISVHVAKIQKDWSERGITFDDQAKARLISVIFHETEDTGDYLFIAHTGVLLPHADGTLTFVEKLAFQEPYQWCRFENRTALSDYLMTKYNLSYDQPTAAAFILENNQLMDGYREKSAAK